MNTSAIKEAVDTYTELLRAHQLNIELLETLEVTLRSMQDFCIANNIPFHSTKVSSLLSKTDALLNELYQEPNRRKVTTPEWKDKNDGEVTVPKLTLYKRGL